MSKYGIFSVPHFPALGPNTERYFVSLRIQSVCGKIRNRKSVFGHFFRSSINTKNKKKILTPFFWSSKFWSVVSTAIKRSNKFGYFPNFASNIMKFKPVNQSVRSIWIRYRRLVFFSKKVNHSESIFELDVSDKIVVENVLLPTFYLNKHMARSCQYLIFYYCRHLSVLNKVF